MPFYSIDSRSTAHRQFVSSRRPPAHDAGGAVLRGPRPAPGRGASARARPSRCPDQDPARGHLQASRVGRGTARSPAAVVAVLKAGVGAGFLGSKEVLPIRVTSCCSCVPAATRRPPPLLQHHRSLPPAHHPRPKLRPEWRLADPTPASPIFCLSGGHLVPPPWASQPACSARCEPAVIPPSSHPQAPLQHWPRNPEGPSPICVPAAPAERVSIPVHLHPCSTDLEILKGYVPGYDSTLGHEFVGTVEQSETRPELVGRRVVSGGCLLPLFGICGSAVVPVGPRWSGARRGRSWWGGAW